LYQNLLVDVDEIDTWVRFNQTFFAKQKVHTVWQKNCCSIAPTIDYPDFRLKSIKNFPNQYNVCQALFTKKASRLAKNKEGILLKSTPGVHIPQIENRCYIVYCCRSYFIKI